MYSTRFGAKNQVGRIIRDMPLISSSFIAASAETTILRSAPAGGVAPSAGTV